MKPYKKVFTSGLPIQKVIKPFKITYKIIKFKAAARCTPKTAIYTLLKK